ncbi:hypothetical protein MUP01_06180 [Candidatus Bathyarchaeota archaeon]|nr:hypothetical protein [Candidatus Bathyarchaeota archaeon]
MSAASPLEEWRFLIGTWKGKADGGQFGQKGAVEGIGVFSCEPSAMFIMATGENWCEGQLLNKSISILFYDAVERKFRRKTFFSYGFVNNEVECSRTRNEVKFDVTMEPLPKQFEGTRWRSFIRRISDSKVAMGMEVAKEGEEFKSYGESILEKTE